MNATARKVKGKGGPRTLPANGVILWAGPSPVDGRPIVCIATGLSRPSVNGKTGDLIQTFIIRADVSPVTASLTGEDVSVCGDCPMRPFHGGACYVTRHQAPQSVYNAYRRGAYRMATASDVALMRGRVRAGSYGDPAMVPTWVWTMLEPRTGYTHQWDRPWCDPTLARWVMASCDSAGQAARAQSMGWRTFTVTAPDACVGPGFRCPATTHGVTCETCGLCCGTRSAARSAWIPAHGATVGRYGIGEVPALRPEVRGLRVVQ